MKKRLTAALIAVPLVALGINAAWFAWRTEQLNQAVQGNDLPAVTALLQQGVPADACDPESRTTPLMHAAQNGDLPLVRLLLKYGASINARGTYFAKTPIMYAVESKHPAVVRELLAQGANPNRLRPPDMPSQWWEPVRDSPLISALSNHDDETAELLVRAGAEVNYKGRGDQTALTIATLAGNRRMKILLQHAGARY